MLEEMEDPEIDTKELLVRQLEGKLSLPIDVLTDCKSLYEVKYSTAEPKPTDSACTLWLRFLRACLRTS